VLHLPPRLLQQGVLHLPPRLLQQDVLHLYPRLLQQGVLQIATSVQRLARATVRLDLDLLLRFEMVRYRRAKDTSVSQPSHEARATSS